MKRQESLLVKYKEIRKRTVEICEPLQIEDYVVQPIEDVSPPKWHLGHTTWFFEVLILEPNLKKYRFYNKKYNYIFNSYYESLGKRISRINRGNFTRPTVDEVLHYREMTDENMEIFFSESLNDQILDLIELGLNHEQQHQELLITDIKYILGHNPLFPLYKNDFKIQNDNTDQFIQSGSLKVNKDLYEIGYKGNNFHYDNEEKIHHVYVNSFSFSDMLTTNLEYEAFIKDGVYKRYEFWSLDGWTWVQENGIETPLYWHLIDNEFYEYTLANGLQRINSHAPVTHISFYEAEAFARWKNLRLLTEFEWEVASYKYGLKEDVNHSNFQDANIFHPIPRTGNSYQLMGDAWEWTNSAYLPYPGYKQANGALGEYNGKFMINQMVLRGGSCATPANHYRNTYRNFLQAEKRWQFTGIRLATDIE
ncbi:MAG TPA: ergothioneine biosynthesis protein EgtB [Bacteroidales bacterium]|nr:ergothioneine biosynthesis protein EgtB [Bacteroidales bacterium]